MELVFPLLSDKRNQPLLNQILANLLDNSKNQNKLFGLVSSGDIFAVISLVNFNCAWYANRWFACALFMLEMIFHIRALNQLKILSLASKWGLEKSEIFTGRCGWAA